MRYMGIIIPIDGPAWDSGDRTDIFWPIVDNDLVLISNLVQWAEKYILCSILKFC